VPFRKPRRMHISTDSRSEPKMVTPQHPERSLMSITTNRPQIAKRRNSRIALNTSIGLSGQDSQKCPFTMPAKATNLNRYGGAIHLPRQLLVGSTVMVRNARGTQVSARVVAQLAASQGISIYGIEFVERDDAANSFWGISFPALEGRTTGAQAAEQVGIARRRRVLPSLQT
jgi:hypothetical protein